VVEKGEPGPGARVRTVQKPVYYVSEVLHEAKTRYIEMHKLIYAILIASKKLLHYFQAHRVVVVTSYPLKNDPAQLQRHGQHRQVGSRVG